MNHSKRQTASGNERPEEAIEENSRAPVEPASSSLTYEPYYGLKEKPFSLKPDPKFLYRSPAHAAAFTELTAAIRRREGLIVLTGGIGTGKTTLCRAVLQHLDRRTFSAFVPDPFVSREDLLKTLLIEFGSISMDDLKNRHLEGHSRHELSYRLYEFLNSLAPLQAFAVLVIDEAQNLSLSLLEEIRILADMEGREKLLQVVLVGQPELRDRLKLPEMRQVDQRVSMRCELTPLGRVGLSSYVNHRLSVAAEGVNTVWFTNDALDAIYEASGGVPRVVNLLCDRALHEGHLESSRQIGMAVVSKAARSLGLVPEGELAGAREPEVSGAESAGSGVDPAQIPLAVRSSRTEAIGSIGEFGSEAEAVTVPAVLPFSTERPADRGRPWRVASVVAATMFAAAVGYSGWYVGQVMAALESAPIPVAPPRDIRAFPSPVFLPAGPAAATQSAAQPALLENSQTAYVIEVASFDESGQSSRLVGELLERGYPARQIEIERVSSAGPTWQVIVGAYQDLDAAMVHLDEIRRLPGFSTSMLRRVGR